MLNVEYTWATWMAMNIKGTANEREKKKRLRVPRASRVFFFVEPIRARPMAAFTWL